MTKDINGAEINILQTPVPENPVITTPVNADAGSIAAGLTQIKQALGLP